MMNQHVSSPGIDLICLAVASGCINMVKMVLSYTSYQEGPINPLCVASFYGYCDIIIYLHEYNSNFINMTAPSSGMYLRSFFTYLLFFYMRVSFFEYVY